MQGLTYRGTSLMRNRPLPRTAIGPYADAFCRVVGGGVFLWARYPCIVPFGAQVPDVLTRANVGLSMVTHTHTHTHTQTHTHTHSTV